MNRTKNKRIYLSVIIPAYNEEDRIRRTLQSVHSYLSRQSFSYEVIVVNDGSRDRTAQAVSCLISEIPYLRLIDNDENHGKGWAVKQGMLSAAGEVRLFMDADNSTSLDQIERMFPFLNNGFDVVIGSRRVKDAVISEHQSWLRENVGRFFNLVMRSLHGIPMEDTQAGFKAFSAAATMRVFPLQTVRQWVFDVELIVICRKFGLKIKEVPIIWRNDPRSNVKPGDTLSTLFDLIKIKWNLWKGAYG